MLTSETIAAIASAPGGAGRGIVRISGLGVLGCLQPQGQQAGFEPQEALDLRQLQSPQVVPGQYLLPEIGPIPCDLFLWPTARSYTGEPTAELHTLGSAPLLSKLLQTVCQSGARLAEPGEFTMRAFLAGKLDLTQAEAVLGVIDAETPAAFSVALAQLAGGISQPLAQLRSDLLDLLADLEAGLDFVEEDIEFISAQQLHARLLSAAAYVQQTAAQMKSRWQATEAVKVVLLGAPNAGKSSLFNALTQGAALVSEIPGTTRDYLTASLIVDEVRLLLVDTAGIEAVSGDQKIAVAAQEMTKAQSEQAVVRLLCVDGSLPEAEQVRQMKEVGSFELLIRTKQDQAPQKQRSLQKNAKQPPPAELWVSSETGVGLSELKHKLKQNALLQAKPQTTVASTAARCEESLRLAAESLDRAAELAVQGQAEELVAAEVRMALFELGKVIGAVYTDDVLDRIFSRFCIGK